MKKQPVFLLLLSLLVIVNLAEIKAQDKTTDEVIKVNTALVSIPVIVSDRQDRYVAGLKAENFAIYQDGEKQKIDYFISEETPISVAILLDTSRSTQQVLGKIKKAAKEFVKDLRPADRAMIVSFDNDIEILSELSSDQKQLEKAIKHAKIGERVGTVLNDAVYEVVKQKLSSVKGRKAIILLTDGKDAGSYTTKSTLLNQLEESDTLVYSIFYDTSKDRPRFQQNNFPFPNRGGGMGGGMGRNGGGMGRGGNFPGGGGQQGRFPPNGGNDRQGKSPDIIRQRGEMSNEKAIEFLQQLSTATAGRFYQKDVTDLTTAFTSITDELRKQYLLGYYPENVEDGKLYQIKVKVDQTGAVVRSKGTYRIKGN